MAERANERIVWFNGAYVPESQARVPFRDFSWLYGDGCFDMTRTFGHRIFRLDQHIERLYRSLKYLRIDPGIGPAEMKRHSEEVLARNLHLLGADEDYWVGQRISRGVKRFAGDNWDHYGPNIVIECCPLPLKERAAFFADGIKVIVPSVRRTAPDALTPRAKTHNYLNLIAGDMEVHSTDPSAWAVLLDANGNLCEGIGSNIFIYKDGTLLTPQSRYVLPGISRQTVIDMAAEEGIPCREADIDLYDAYVAEECFLTSTSLCLCPVVSLNGQRIGPAGQVWGPVTRRLADAYIRHVGHDFVRQYLDKRGDGPATPALM
jgi:branched-chain amino acid aminotransferase